MLIAVIGDIHGNYHALKAVLAGIDERGVDKLLCVGDVVGYGAHPVECLNVVRERAALLVAGNHDWAVAEKISTDYFNADAGDSIAWTRDRLPAEDVRYLGGLPLVVFEEEDVALVHSSPYAPGDFDYIQTIYDARLAFNSLKKRVCFVGHSHVPIVFFNSDPIHYFLESQFKLPPSGKVIVNVGSVGQPRDLNPKAGYAIYDTEAERVFMHRVDYDVAGASRAIKDAGLPATNAFRLRVGR